MCTPVAAVAMVAAAGVGNAASTYQGDRANQKASYVQADIYNRNANLKEQQARDALARGDVAEGQQRMKEESLVGTQRSIFASRGLSADEGSALNILDTTRHMSDVDIATIQSNTSKEAAALRTTSQNDRRTAELYKERGDNTNPRTDAFLSLIGGGGNVASSWYKLNGPGSTAGPG